MNGSGAGLGLTLARRIVEVHGGKLDVRSTLGQGSTLVIQLPLSNVVLSKASLAFG